jgi:lipoprotein-anchoring transpeptidase ErfK/SrfK
VPRVRTAQANMGGGFIEFLFTGPGDASPSRAYRGGRGEPQAVPFYREPSYEVDPFAGRQRYPQYARGEPGEMAAPERQAVNPKFRKQVVDYDGKHRPGTIIIDTPNRFLYLVQPGGRALRYGIGVGRPGFTWAGTKAVTMKKEWPDWRPPPEMLKRRPDLPSFMAGGPENPLGARALYLGSSLYRIHGSNEPWTIGQAVSSGCIRMRNEDVTDLYERVKVGTRVIVM